MASGTNTTDSPNYAYVNEEEINVNMKCSVCGSPFIDPRCTPCRHTFCLRCITPWLETGADTCPTCRKKLSLRVLEPAPREFCNLLDDLKVKCLVCGDIKLQRGQFKVHWEKSCPKINVSSSSSNNQNHVPMDSQSQSSTSDNHQPTAPQNTSGRNDRCHVDGCSTGLNRVPCSHCYQYFCLAHLPTHSAQCRTNERREFFPDVSSIWIVIFAVIVLLCYKGKNLNSLEESTQVSQNKPTVEPTFCSDPIQCPTRRVPFKDSQLLTDQHQNYLNYFYNRTEIHLLQWDLIYRGSTDGFNAIAFHTHCDNKGQTLIVLSTTKGYLFGGYTDANWTTPAQGLPTYGRSSKTFLFSLVTPEKTSPQKFILDVRHENYAIVSDFLSGPIFGAMMRPDIGVLDFNGEFRCQINFPSLYRGAVGGSSFPTSESCIINEIEVFIPVFTFASKGKLSIVYGALKLVLGLLIAAVTCFLYLFVHLAYEENKRSEARFWAGLCLLLVWINYLYGYQILSILIFSILLFMEWDKPNGSRELEDLRTEKRFLISFFLLFSVYLAFIV